MKNWIEIGEHNRPEVITVNILEDEEAVNLTKELEKSEWDYLFIDHREYSNRLSEYNEKIKEVMLPPNYDEAIFSHYNPSEIEIEIEINGQKIWLDNESEKRPESIVLYLYANDEVVDRQVVRKSEHWRYRFTNIPLYDADRNLIDYQIEEREIEGYETSYEGWNIINRRAEKTEGKISKKWKVSEENSLPESIQVQLLRNGEKIKNMNLTPENDWQYSLTNLELYDQSGKPYEYAVIESSPSNLGHPVEIKIGEDDEEKKQEAQKNGLALVGGALILLGLASKFRNKD